MTFTFFRVYNGTYCCCPALPRGTIYPSINSNNNGGFDLLYIESILSHDYRLVLNTFIWCITIMPLQNTSACQLSMLWGCTLMAFTLIQKNVCQSQEVLLLHSSLKETLSACVGAESDTSSGNQEGLRQAWQP